MSGWAKKKTTGRKDETLEILEQVKKCLEELLLEIGESSVPESPEKRTSKRSKFASTSPPMLPLRRGAKKRKICQSMMDSEGLAKAKHLLFVHIQSKMASAPGDGHQQTVASTSTGREVTTSEPRADEDMNLVVPLAVENIKVEKDDTSCNEPRGFVPSPVQLHPQAAGIIMADSLSSLNNSILDEVLNEKKRELMQSPEVIRFLNEAQQKRKE